MSKIKALDDEFDSPINYTSRSASAVTNILETPVGPKNIYSKKNSEYSKREQENSQNDENEDDESTKKNGCKGMLKFLMTNVGLIVLVILYIIGGAFLFQLLEQHNSVQNCQEGEGEMESLITEYRTNLFNYIYFNVTLDPWLPNNATVTKDGPSVYNPILNNMLTTFRTKVLEIRTNYTYYGQDCEANSLWNYQSAILFALTVVTTIGYGHVSPTTWEGQIVCICYATLGIPIFLMSIANVSCLLGDMFRFLYSHVFCFFCRPCFKKSDDDDESKKKKKNDQMSRNVAGEIKSAANDDTYENQKSKAKVIDAEEDDNDANDDVNVPLAIVILIIGLYIALGGYLFQMLENWTIVSSCYFSYISLATIGFGDYVPGISALSKGTDNGVGGRNLIVAAIYVFFGMAILAMCFDLIQEGLISKFSLIGKKLGISKDENEEQKKEVVTEEIYKGTEQEKRVSRSARLKSSSLSEVYANENISRKNSSIGFRTPTNLFKANSIQNEYKY